MARVLVVDNSEMVCKSLKTALERRGHVVHTAYSIRDACQAFEESVRRGQPYEVCTVELWFEDYRGTETLPERAGLLIIHAAREKIPYLEAVVVTAFPSVITALESLNRGVFRYLTKASGKAFIEELAEAVAHAAASSEAKRAGNASRKGACSPGRQLAQAKLSVDAALAATDQRNVTWLLDRLSKSTAGVRGLIADTPRLSALTLEDAERTPQLSPTIVALIAQAYAQYFLAAPGDANGAFVGFDARFLSREFGDIFTRIFAGNGLRVVRDHRGEPTATPVTSFMAVYSVLDGGIQITASHNPPNHNGVKSSTCYGGVDTDDISDRIAAQILALINPPGDQDAEIRFAALPSPLVEEVDAKGIYAEVYLRATFPPEDLEPLRQAIQDGAGFLFDGLHGVGGMAMRQYLDILLPGTDWSRSIHLLNAKPNSSIGGIEKPDPSDPNTLVLSGAISYLVEHPEVLVSVTADMDADRIGTAVLIPEEQVARARRFGLFVTAFKGGVYAVRFTPNQIFTLIAYDRLLSATGCSPDELREAVRSGRVLGSRYHLLTTIASSVLAEQLAKAYGLSFHLTAVGFKNLGKLAWQIDRRGQGDVILALMEESGGAQIGPFRPWNEAGDTIHRDKDTCALALALFKLAARLKLEGRTVLDFYLQMADQFGSLAYFERLDAYLPNREVAEDPERADEANRVKEEILKRLVALSKPENGMKLLELLGYKRKKAQAEPPVEVEEISLLVKEGGEWKTIHPEASRYRIANGEQVEFYRAGPAPHDGMRINVYDREGQMRHWCLCRASGTEAVLRVYMEIVEPFEHPNPMRLAEQFEPFLRYLGLDRYRNDDSFPDYMTEFRQTVKSKYVDKED
jgi:phosphomannomutase/ActR/RegA family two-component response regulator